MFLRFLIVGGTGFLIDVGISYLLISLDVSAWLARPPAIVVSTLFTWLVNRQFTYRQKNRKSISEAIRYGLVATCMATLNYSVYLLLLEVNIHPLVAICIATGLQAVFSFFAYRRLVFKDNN